MLINEEVPREFLKSQEGHLDERDYGKMLNDYDEKLSDSGDRCAACNYLRQ